MKLAFTFIAFVGLIGFTLGYLNGARITDSNERVVALITTFNCEIAKEMEGAGNASCIAAH